ncbi:MAG: universal stress protein [Leptolyngbyaceae cyanobacterium]
MFSKILVALDQGDTYIPLFQAAVKLAQATSAELMLLSVVAPQSEEGLTIPVASGLAHCSLSANEAIWEAYQKNLRGYEEQGLKRLRSLSEEAALLGLQAEFTQSFGSPERVICDLARTWAADLIMVGSHQRTGFSEWVMGSVSNYVLHHAPCSVLMINRLTGQPATSPSAELAARES